MENLDRDGLQILVDLGAEPATVVWQGSADAADPGSYLYPYLEDLARALAGRECVVDFRTLEYMNSPSAGPVFHFIKDLDARGAKTEVLYSESIHWQRTSLRALKIIAIRLEQVTITGM